MEYLHGGELLDRIVESTSFSESEARAIMSQILHGVQYLHSKGIVHRDLKPENLVYSSRAENAVLKIIDFDLSKNLSGGDTASTPCGTRQYMAPEIVGEYRHSLSVDMWSVGCIAFLVLSGCFPFSTEDDTERERMITECSYTFDSEVWSGVSDTAKSFVAGLLQAEPHQRMTATEALNHPWLTNEVRAESDRQLQTPSNYRGLRASSSFSKLSSSISKSLSMQRLDDDGSDGATPIAPQLEFPSLSHKSLLSRRAFGSGKKKKRRSAGGVSTSSDEERASNIRRSLDEAVSTPELDPASAVDDMRRRSSEVHRFDTRRGSLATPSELFENQEKADIRLSKARDEISFYQRIVSGKQDVVYDGDGSPGFLYHSHSMEMMQMMQMEQASPSSARISSDASAASPSIKIRNSV